MLKFVFFEWIAPYKNTCFSLCVFRTVLLMHVSKNDRKKKKEPWLLLYFGALKFILEKHLEAHHVTFQSTPVCRRAVVENLWCIQNITVYYNNTVSTIPDHSRRLHHTNIQKYTLKWIVFENTGERIRIPGCHSLIFTSEMRYQLCRQQIITVGNHSHAANFSRVII